jgi:DNA modification methylase
MRNQYIIGNVNETKEQLEDESVDLFVTSPPYWAQRKYITEEQSEKGIDFPVIWDGKDDCDHPSWISVPPMTRKHTKGDVPGPNSMIASKRTKYENRSAEDSLWCGKCGAWKGDLGQEPDLFLYLKHLCDIFDSLKPKLKERGTLVVNLGDKKNDSGGAGNQYTKWRKKHTAFGKTVGGVGQCYPMRIDALRPRCWLLLPELFATTMVYQRGWVCYSKPIWYKKTPAPYSGKRNFTPAYEPLYWFSKNESYYFNQQKVKSKHPTASRITSFGGTRKAKDTKKAYSNPTYSGVKKYNARRTSNMKDVFHLDTNKSRGGKGIKHFATYPPKLVEIAIRACCPEGGLVVDPFGGVGNTAVAANNCDRDWIMMEINPKYEEFGKINIQKSEYNRSARKNTLTVFD